MSFISTFYLLFLLISTSIYYTLAQKYRVFWILLVSYLFYLSWQPLFLFVLIGETILAFLFGKKIDLITDKKKKKKCLFFAISIILLPLIFFKYFNFLYYNLSEFLGIFKIEINTLNQPYIIPIGISFFTFQAISYLVDINRGYLKPEVKIEKIAAYMAFFPTILAGPIERAKSILGQFNNPITFEYQNIRSGLQLILWGVFKKVVLADRLKYFMDNIYENPENAQGILIYLTMVFSVFQLFCDFSAYSDIAVGSARLFGLKISKNFDDRVYASPSRTIFWQGWHRSLTSWLRDYVFFPLSKNVNNQNHLYQNLLIVYLLVGIWHGATWGFIIWGLLNGIWILIESITKKWRHKLFTQLGFNIEGKLFRFLGWLLVFHIGAFFGIFFRTISLQKAFNFIGNITNSNNDLFMRLEVKSVVIIILCLIFMDFINRHIPKNENFDSYISKKKAWFRWSIYIILAELSLHYLFMFKKFEFMYFNY